MGMPTIPDLDLEGETRDVTPLNRSSGYYRLMKEDLALFESHYNPQALANAGTRWHFITPGASHQGGLWEAAVKSAKHHLIGLVGSQSLWHHQLHTLAVRIEACLNSRPLVPLHDDPEDKLALTPGDFLIGAPLIAVPEPRIDDIPINRLKQWSEEYLCTLQTRNKWEKREPNLRVDDIVLVRNENLPPTHWRLGRVTAVHLGNDGLARNATLRLPPASVAAPSRNFVD
ncbi:uncharacterized protein LOC129951106 [Eupeodes corollae]|uniref:uncharacterized protein LOC129951106 n=1 Tax=Eupeodes corollae TaxID=290404 RepID=UPI00248F6C73|nr:uncharacterized protein LOC129951106 [Eupeodes corollae]